MVISGCEQFPCFQPYTHEGFECLFNDGFHRLPAAGKWKTSPSWVPEYIQASNTVPHENHHTTAVERGTEMQPTAQSDDEFFCYEDDKHYFSEADLPGVKAENIFVEYSNDDTIIALAHRGSKSRYEKKLPLQEYCLDPNSFHASLTDGVLCLRALKTKRQEAPSESCICVQAGEPPLQSSEGEFFQELDIPGAKIEDVTVLLSQDKRKLTVTAKRYGGRLPVQQSYTIYPNKVDTSKVNAYLSDGVLCMRAPQKEISKRRIFVQAEGKQYSNKGHAEWFRRGFLKNHKHAMNNHKHAMKQENQKLKTTTNTAEWFHSGFLIKPNGGRCKDVCKVKHPSEHCYNERLKRCKPSTF